MRNYILTDGDKKIFEASRSDGSIFTSYYFKSPINPSGWYFDDWQNAIHLALQPTTCLIGGFGCLSGDAHIYDVGLDEHIKIEELWESRRAPLVMSWTGDGFKPVQALTPFVKGRADLYRVKMASGRQIKATLDHVFLTNCGWRRLSQLSVGDWLLGCAHDPLKSSLESSRLALALDGRSSSRRVVDSRYCFSDDYPSPCDEQPPMDIEVVQDVSPSQVDVLERIRPDWHMDDLSPRQEHIHPCPRFCHHSNIHSLDQVGLLVLPEVESHEGVFGGVPAPPSLEVLAPEQSLCSSYPRLPTPGFDLDNYLAERAFYTWEDHLSSSYDYSLSEAPYDCIVEIVYSQESEYFDIQVPDYHNYLAEGLVNHNSGKTAGLAMSAAVWAATVPFFRFKDAAPTARQSMEMYQYLRDRLYEGVPYYDRFVVKMVTKPWPKIELYNGSSLEFMSADKNAEKIKTLEADWVCIDQAEDVDDLYETTRNAGTRLRGTRPDGQPRLSRLTYLANAGDNPQLWEIYDRHEIDPDHYLSLTIATYENWHNTPEQIKLLEDRTGGTSKDIDQWLKAKRPMGKGEYFPPSVIESCTDEGLDRLMDIGIEEKWPQFVCEEYRGAGIVRWELPPDPKRIYMQVADLGTRNPPDRGAGCIMVFDVTEFPKKPASLRAFNWVISNSMITPWLDWFKFYIDYYNTGTRAAFDSTGLQKHFDELSFQVENLQVMGLNFQGLKSFMLRALQIFTAKGLFKWPGKIKGIPFQLSRYKLPDTRLPQDITVTLMMAAWMLEQLFWDGSELEGSLSEEDMVSVDDRNARPLLDRDGALRET